jgi:hypothetical protein
MEFPKSWPVPDSVPRPITARVWLEEGAKILEKAEMVPGHLASANLIGARITGTDPKVMAAVIRGALMNGLPAEALQRVDIPVLILNGKADAANPKIAGLLFRILANEWDGLGGSNVVPRIPVFISRDGSEVFLNDLLSPRQSVAPAHEELMAESVEGSARFTQL